MNVEKAEINMLRVATKGKLDDCVSAIMKAQDSLDETIELMNEVLEEAGIISSNTRTIEIHDLRKDPTDLPENGGHYLTWNVYGVNVVLPYYNGFNCLEHYRGAEDTNIVAWAEVPKL